MGWLGQHLFHLTGVAARLHSTDSRDTALGWIAAGLVVPAALLFSLLWTLLDRRRLHYEQTAVWLRFVLRLGLIFLMLRYGLMKLMPLQMPPPSLAVLNEPVGNTSPMTLLWTLIGLHPLYEMIAGAMETLAAILLVFRRTALLGAMLTLAVMINVLLYNMFFDVPVKLGALNVLVLSFALIVPDLPVLYRFLLRRESAALISRWVPRTNSSVAKAGLRAAEILLVVFAVIQFVPYLASEIAGQRAALRHPSALSGEWHMDSVVRSEGDRHVPLPVLTGEGQPMTAIILEPNGMVNVRSADGKLWRAQAHIDQAKHSFVLDSPYFEGERFAASYAMSQPNANQLTLTPVGGAAATNGTMTLTRVPLLAHYPLLERRFHWVNEWALER